MSILNNFTPSDHIITNRLPHLYTFGCTSKPFGKPIIFFKENNIDYCFGQLNPGNASGTHLGLINLTDNIVEFTSEWYPMLSVSPDDPNFMITNLRDNENHAYDEMTLAPDGFSDFSLISYNNTKYILCIGTYERNSDNIYNGSALLYNISTRKIDDIIASNYLQELITTKKINFLEENDAVFNNISENSYETYSNSNSNLKLTLELEIDINDKKWYYILNNGSRMSYTDSENQVDEVCFYFDDKVFGFNNNVNSKYSSYYGEPFLFFNKNSETYAIFSGIDKNHNGYPWIYIVNCKTKELTIKSVEDFIMNNNDHLQDIFIPSGYTLSQKDNSSVEALTCFALVQYNNKTYISALALHNEEFDIWDSTFRFLIDIDTFEFTYVVGTDSTAEITLLPNIKTVYKFDEVNRIFEYSNESNDYTVKSKIREGETVTNLRYDELLSNEYVQVVTETEQAINILKKERLICKDTNYGNGWLNYEFIIDDGYWHNLMNGLRSRNDGEFLLVHPEDLNTKPLFFILNDKKLCVANVIKVQDNDLSVPTLLAIIDTESFEIIKIYNDSGNIINFYNFSIIEYENKKYIKFDGIYQGGSSDNVYENLLANIEDENDYYLYSYNDSVSYGSEYFYSNEKYASPLKFDDRYHINASESDFTLIKNNDTEISYQDDNIKYYSNGNMNIGTFIDNDVFNSVDVSKYEGAPFDVTYIKKILSSYDIKGTFSSNPKSISYLENNKLICDQSQFVLDVNGDIYAKGDNEFGKLGIGSDDSFINSWEKINFANLITKSNIQEIISCIEDVKRDYFVFKISNDKQYFAGKFGNKNYTAVRDFDGILDEMYPLKEAKKFKESDRYVDTYFKNFKNISGEEFLVATFQNEDINDLIGVEIIISTNNDIISLTLSGIKDNHLVTYANYIVNPKNKIEVTVKSFTTGENNSDENLKGIFLKITKEKEELSEISNNLIESRVTIKNVFGNIIENKENFVTDESVIYFNKEFERSDISYFGPIDFESKHSVLVPNSPINEFIMIDVNVDIGETKLIINNPGLIDSEYVDKEIIPYEEDEYKGPQFLYPIFYNLGIPFNKYVKFEGVITVDGTEYLVSHVMISRPLDSSNKFGVIQFILSDDNKLFNNEALSDFEDGEKSNSIFGITFYPIYEDGDTLKYRVIDNIPNSIVSQNNEMSIVGKELINYEIIKGGSDSYKFESRKLIDSTIITEEMVEEALGNEQSNGEYSITLNPTSKEILFFKNNGVNYAFFCLQKETENIFDSDAELNRYIVLMNCDTLDLVYDEKINADTLNNEYDSYLKDAIQNYANFNFIPSFNDNNQEWLNRLLFNTIMQLDDFELVEYNGTRYIKALQYGIKRNENDENNIITTNLDVVHLFDINTGKIEYLIFKEEYDQLINSGTIVVINENQTPLIKEELESGNVFRYTGLNEENESVSLYTNNEKRLAFAIKDTNSSENENTIENLISNSIKRFDNFICIKIDNGVIIINSLTGKIIQKFTSLSLVNENTNNFTIHINDNGGIKEFAIKYNNQYLILSEFDEGEFIDSINEIESDDFVFTDLSDNSNYINKYKIKENEYCYEISFDDIKIVYKMEK